MQDGMAEPHHRVLTLGQGAGSLAPYWREPGRKLFPIPLSASSARQTRAMKSMKSPPPRSMAAGSVSTQAMAMERRVEN